MHDKELHKLYDLLDTLVTRSSGRMMWTEPREHIEEKGIDVGSLLYDIVQPHMAAVTRALLEESKCKII
jgi:hypothetical protein